MELLLNFRSLVADHDDKKCAVILCSHDKVIRSLTYNDVVTHADNIGQFIQNIIIGNNICVGLLMEKNIFIPSIILSFQDLCYSFVFVTAQTLTRTVQSLNIKWLLSYECDPVADYFILADLLQFSNNGELKLWKNSSTYLETAQSLSFNGIFCAIQTSGSTGENKIVRVPHSCIERNVISLNKHFELSNVDLIYWGTPLTFDPTLVEYLLGVHCRATLLIVSKLDSLNPKFLHDALFKIGRVTFLQIVPSIFLRWNKRQIASILHDSNLTSLAFGGEPFPQEILEYERRKDLKVFNLYGVTELSCWATIAKVTSESIYKDGVPLGETLDETFIELRNHDQIVQNGTGEIYIGSNTRYCLLNDSEENVTFPFVVRTGDLGEFNDHGLVYKGRKTRIIKRFGHKVNLHKLEEVILKEINLPSRLVYSIPHKKLLAFVLIEEYFNKNVKIRVLDKLRIKLLKIITDTEFPDFIDVVSQFPLNEHGKICDKMLEKYYEHSLSNLVVNIHSSKDVFIKILDDYLRTDKFSSNIASLGKYTFFQLGGNSILAMQLLSEFEEYTGRDIPGDLVTLILNESVQSCISYVQDHVSLKRKLPEVAVPKKSKKKLIIVSNVPNCVVWTSNLQGCVDSSPVVFDKSSETYIASGSFAHIFAVLKENGEEYLKLDLPQEVEAKPCISKCGNFIFIGCTNGSMYSIDLSRKIIGWEYRTLQKISCAACLCRKSTAIVFGSYDSFVYCLTTKGGNLLWKTKLLGSIRANLLYCQNLKTVYIGTTRGMCYALNEENGTVIWTYKVDGPIFGSPCLISEHVIWPSVTGVLYSISLTGELKWTQTVKGNIFSSLSISGNKIYFGCHDSRLYELTISDNDHVISNTFLLESEISSTPFVYNYDNKILVVCVCNVGRLYAIDANSGEIVFNYKLPAQSFSSPYVFNDMVYIGCRDNHLYCIDMKKALIN